jgi:hypothetical protein
MEFATLVVTIVVPISKSSPTVNRSGFCIKCVLAQAERTLGHRNGKGKGSKRNCEDGSHEHHCLQLDKLVAKKRGVEVVNDDG